MVCTKYAKYEAMIRKKNCFKFHSSGHIKRGNIVELCGWPLSQFSLGACSVRGTPNIISAAHDHFPRNSNIFAQVWKDRGMPQRTYTCKSFVKKVIKNF